MYETSQQKLIDRQLEIEFSTNSQLLRISIILHKRDIVEKIC